MNKSTLNFSDEHKPLDLNKPLGQCSFGELQRMMALHAITSTVNFIRDTENEEAPANEKIQVFAIEIFCSSQADIIGDLELDIKKLCSIPNIQSQVPSEDPED